MSAEGGLGVASEGNGNTAVYATITNTGRVEVTVTTSDGEIHQKEFQFLSTDQPTSDYR
jgi:hypothetical protein